MGLSSRSARNTTWAMPGSARYPALLSAGNLGSSGPIGHGRQSCRDAPCGKRGRSSTASTLDRRAKDWEPSTSSSSSACQTTIVRRELAADVGIVLRDPAADGERRIAARARRRGRRGGRICQFERPSSGLFEGVLAVDPAGEAVADKGGIDGVEEPLMLGVVDGDEAGRELGALRVEQVDRLVDRVGRS